MNLQEIIDYLETMEQEESDKCILKTLNFELGYCYALQNLGFEDGRMNYIITNIINEHKGIT